MVKDCYISDDLLYRYELYRNWDASKEMVFFIMLNPSKADAESDDPTIRRCIGFAKSWGYGSICVGNLFPFRTTDPKTLLKCENPFGERNIKHLKYMSQISSMTICAWGNKAIVDNILKTNKCSIGDLIGGIEGAEDLHCIAVSKDNVPKCPLYLKSDLLPVPYNFN